MNTIAQRVLVIGLDGATWDVLMPLAELGVMPNLAHLIQRAALAELESTSPCITPVAWTTFQTGCDPARHGVWDFRWLDHRERRLRLTNIGRINCPTLFDHVAAAGGTTVSINLPMTHGAGRPGKDIVVGGIEAPHAAAALAREPRLRALLETAGVEYPLDAVWKHRPTTFEELQAGVARTQTAFRSRAAAALAADQLVDWQLMMVQFQALDPLQHRCWHLLGVHSDLGGPATWVTEVQRALRTLDDALGELLELDSRRGASIALLSDHGFGPFREKISVVELLRRRGLLRLPTKLGQIGYRVRRTFWKTSRWAHRHLQSHVGSRASLPRPLEALLPIDWRNSAAVACHGNLAAMIYLNTPERFGSGPISTAAKREQAVADVIATLDEARHPETDEPLFQTTYSTAELFDCDPVERNLPDVMGIPADGFHTRHKFDRAGLLMRTDPSLTGTHRASGVLMLSAAGVQTQRQYQTHIRNVAPTLLQLLGIEPLQPIDGAPLAAMFSHSISARRNTNSDALLADYSSAGNSSSRAWATSPGPVAELTAAGQQQLVEQRLRDLGYID